MLAFAACTPLSGHGARFDLAINVLEAANTCKIKKYPCVTSHLVPGFNPNPSVRDKSNSTKDNSNTDRPPQWLLDVNHFLVGSAVTTVNALYDGANEPWYRLWVLEVVARVPYFSFLCILHLAESLGLGSERLSELQRRHFEENENEAVHLAIMATLGGGSRFRDRFIAQHAAIVYFLGTCIAYVVSPSLAYHFSTLVEQHAYETYDALLRKKEQFLKSVAPVPIIARKYYSQRAYDRRQIHSMWDVIQAIRDDEAQHSEDLQFYSIDSFENVPWRYPNVIENETS